jgi:hypothetical protein
MSDGTQPKQDPKKDQERKNDYLSKLWSREQAGVVRLSHVRDFA